MSAGGHGKRRKGGGGHDEEHESSERWLLTYADMITLLMVLFIVLFAISQVDQKKFAALKSGLAAGFGADTPFDGGTGVLLDNGQVSKPISVSPDIQATVVGANGHAAAPDASTQALSASQQTVQQAVVAKAVQQALRSVDLVRAQAAMAAAEREVANLRQLQQQIERSLGLHHVAAGVRFGIDERGLTVTVVTSSVVFVGDQAALLPAGQQILDAVGPPLLRLPNHIEVDGHTNQLPVPTLNYPSAWELSTARASTVVRYLIDQHGLAPQRLSAAGFAGERPLYPPSDPRAPTLNRRVEIIVLSALPPQERALLPIAAGTASG